jgi:hypothetical protein
MKSIQLTERIEKQRENSYEHILRMAVDRLPEILLNYKPKGQQYLKTHS